MARGAFHQTGCWRLLCGAAVRTELRADWILSAAFRARNGLRLCRARPLAVLPSDRACHHLAVSDSQTEAHSLSGGSAFLLCCILNRLRGFELHIGVHIADRAHA